MLMRRRQTPRARFLNALRGVLPSVLLGAQMGLLGGAAAAATATAETELAGWLPPSNTVREILLASPALQAARSRRSAQGFQAEAIRAGAAETSLRSSLQLRRSRDRQEPFVEPVIAIERPIRAWGKEALDANLAAQTLAAAQIEYADVVHEASRELLKHWFGHLRALIARQNAAAALTAAAQLQQLARIRLQRGELARLDVLLAEAETQRAEANVHSAEGQLKGAELALRRLYPGLSPVDQVAGSALPVLALDGVALVPEFLEKNHELNWRRADAQRLRLLGQRFERDRLPDPIVGLYAASERSGAEQLTGISLQVPIAGVTRTANARAALAQAQSAAENLARLEQELTAGFEARWAELNNRYKAAANLAAAADKQARSAASVRRAFAQGEFSTAQVIQTERQAAELRTQAQLEQLEVVALLAQLQLDLHQIWDFDD